MEVVSVLKFYSKTSLQTVILVSANFNKIFQKLLVSTGLMAISGILYSVETYFTVIISTYTALHYSRLWKSSCVASFL